MIVRMLSDFRTKCAKKILKGFDGESGVVSQQHFFPASDGRSLDTHLTECPQEWPGIQPLSPILEMLYEVTILEFPYFVPGEETAKLSHTGRGGVLGIGVVIRPKGGRFEVGGL